MKLLTAPIKHKKQKKTQQNSKMNLNTVRTWDISLKAISELQQEVHWYTQTEETCGFSQLWNTLFSLLALQKLVALQACHAFCFCPSCNWPLLLAPCQHFSFTACRSILCSSVLWLFLILNHNVQKIGFCLDCNPSQKHPYTEATWQLMSKSIEGSI